MADINIKDFWIENGEEQLAGEYFNVGVVVNNQEWAAGFGNENACTIGEDEVPGHKAEITVKVIDGNEVVETESRKVCAPIEGASMVSTRDPEETFPVKLSPGSYVVKATVKGTPSGPPHTKESSIVVREEADAPPADDGGNDGGGSGGLPPLGDADSDGTPNMMDPAPQDPDKPAGGGLPGLGLSTTQQAGLAVGAVLVVMLIARPYASLADGVTG